MKTERNGAEDTDQAQLGISNEVSSKTEPQHSTAELDENNNPAVENEPSSTKTNTSGSSFPPLQNHVELVNTCLAKISQNSQGYLATKILYTIAHLLPSPSKIPKPLLFALHTEEGVSATVKALQLIRRSLIITDHGFHYSIESQLQDAIICNLKNSSGKNNNLSCIFDRKIFRNFKRFLVSLSNSKSDSLYSEAIENSLHFTISTLSNVVSCDNDYINTANGSKRIITADPLELAHYVAWEVRESHMEKSATLYKKLIEYYTQKYTKVSNSNSNSTRLAAKNLLRDAKIEIQMDLWLCKNNLAIVLRSLKNFKESHQILVDILDKEEKVLGRRHPLTMTTIHELLEIQKEFQVGDITSGTAAVDSAEESVIKTKIPTDHYQDNLARIRFNRENYKSAVRTVEKIAPRRLEILGPRQQDYERNVILRSKSLPKIAEVSKYNSRRSSSMLGFGLGSGVFPQYFKALCKTDEGHWTASSTSLSSTNLPKETGSTGFSGTLRRSYSFREPRPCAMHDAVPLIVRAKLLTPAKSVEVLNTGTIVKTQQKLGSKALNKIGPSIENLRTVREHPNKIMQTPRISSDKQIKTPSSIKASQEDFQQMVGKPLTNFSRNSTKPKSNKVSELFKTA